MNLALLFLNLHLFLTPLHGLQMQVVSTARPAAVLSDPSRTIPPAHSYGPGGRTGGPGAENSAMCPSCPSCCRGPSPTQPQFRIGRVRREESREIEKIS